MHGLHNHFLDNVPWYRSWHNNTRHPIYHWILFVSIVSCAALNLNICINNSTDFGTFGTPVAHASTVGSNTFTGTGWATFGQVVPRGYATQGLQVGNFPTQTDVKNRWSDGSIKFAILTAYIQSPGTYNITDGSSESNLGSLTPTWPQASVEFTTGGQTYTADLPAFTPSDDWLSDGPQVRESRVLVTPRAGGVAHPLLQVIFDVRSYTTGGTSTATPTRLDVTVQNVKDVTNGGPVSYSVAVKLEGQIVYSNTVNQGYGTRWHKYFLSSDLQGHVSQFAPDMSPFVQAGAIPQILSSVKNPNYSSSGSNFDILQYGDMTADMASPGGRPDIGYLPYWIAQYVAHERPSQFDYMLAQADLSGSWSGHLLSANDSTGTGLLRVDQGIGSNFWLDGRAGTNNTLGDGSYGPNITPRLMHNGGPFIGWPIIEVAHEPSLTYVPYLVTGTRYYMDQMKFWANYGILIARGNRQGSKGLIVYDNQVRGMAWGLRAIVDAGAYVPDNDSMKNYFINIAQNNITELDNWAVRPDGGPFRWVLLQCDAQNASGRGCLQSIWMNSYVAYSIDHAAAQGYSTNNAMQIRIAQNMILLLSSAAQGFPQNGAITGWIWVTPPHDNSNFDTTMAQVFLHTTDPTYGDPRAGTTNGISWSGYYGPEAHYSLMTGVKFNVPGAQAGLTYIDNQGVLGDLNDRSGFAVESLWTSISGNTVQPPAAQQQQNNQDTTAPQVSITSPLNNASVTGTINVLANATDNVGVAGVQFKLDGSNIGAEDTGSPYSYSLNTTSYSNGNHTLTAIARDAAGNSATSASVTISISGSATTYLQGDLNQDHIVNSFDWSIMNAKWFKPDPVADLDKNGLVNSIDFSLLNKDWFKTL